MKYTMSIFIACFGLLLSSLAYSSCGSESDDRYASDAVTSECHCADLSCPDRYVNNCMSRSRCCEAFGNIGSLEN